MQKGHLHLQGNRARQQQKNTHLSCTVNKKNCHIIFDPQIKMFVFLTYFKMYYLMSLENGVMRVTQQTSDNKELIVR